MNDEYPLISCICVTREKPRLLSRAIDCFLAQTYPNRELIILYEDDDTATKDFIGSIRPNPQIKTTIVARSSQIRLGQLRNMAIQEAHGEYICQWDDDDWYHAGRLEYQYAIITQTGYAGCIMLKWIIFDSTTGQAYISNPRLWEGSILCKKNILLPGSYENKSVGEDTILIETLFSNKALYPIMHVPHLYIYNYHVGNTWDRAHWEFIFKSGTPLSDEINFEITRIMANAYDAVEGALLLDKLLNIPIVERAD